MVRENWNVNRISTLIQKTHCHLEQQDQSPRSNQRQLVRAKGKDMVLPK